MTENIICEIHNSPVGGVCSDTSCNNYPSLLCIKCIVDPKCCIRKSNHKLISINEYLNKYFSDHTSTYSNISNFLASYKKLKTNDLPKIKDFIQTIYNEESKIYNKEAINTKISSILDEAASLSATQELNKIPIFSNKMKVIEDFQKNIPIIINEREFDFIKKCEDFTNEYKNSKNKSNSLYTQLNTYLTEVKTLLRSFNNNNLSESASFAQQIQSMPADNINSLIKEFSTNFNLIVEQISNDLNQHFSNENKNCFSLGQKTNFKSNIEIKPKTDKKKLAEQMNIFKRGEKVTLDNFVTKQKKIVKMSTNKFQEIKPIPLTKPNHSPKFNMFDSIGKKSIVINSNPFLLNSNPSENPFVIKSSILPEKQNSFISNLSAKVPGKLSPFIYTNEEFQLEESFKFKRISNFSNLNMQEKNLLPLNHIPEYPIINDEMAIVVEEFHLIIFSNSSGLYVYDISVQHVVFHLKSEENEKFYQKKFVNHTLKLYALSSKNVIIEVDLSDYLDELSFLDGPESNCTYRIIKIDEKLNLLPVFEINFEFPLMNYINNNPNKYFYFVTKDSIQSWLFANDTLILDKKMPVISVEMNILTSKLELFENNLGPTYYSTEFEFDSYVLNSLKKYLVFLNEDIKIYNEEKFELYFVIQNSNNPFKTASSFYIENLKSTNETIIYSVWNDGLIQIHSLKEKSLIKSINCFHYTNQQVSLYSICYINEHALLVGSDDKVFLVSNSDEVTPKCWPCAQSGKILSIKIYVEKSKEFFIIFSNNGLIKLFK